MTAVQSSTASDALSQILANSATTSSGTSSSASTTAPSADQMQQQFLKLLVTQMQNQDPINPMDSSQMTAQLAQISTVSGINTLNTTLQSLVSSMASSQSVQAAGLIGKDVLVPGSSISLANGTAGSFGVNLTQAVDNLTATVTDSSGRLVRTIGLGAQNAGTTSFTWDGKSDSGATAADGQYNIAFSATQGGSKIATTALVSAHVASVSTGSQGVVLNLGTSGAVPLSQVQQIL